MTDEGLRAVSNMPALTSLGKLMTDLSTGSDRPTALRWCDLPPVAHCCAVYVETVLQLGASEWQLCGEDGQMG